MWVNHTYILVYINLISSKARSCPYQHFEHHDDHFGSVFQKFSSAGSGQLLSFRPSNSLVSRFGLFLPELLCMGFSLQFGHLLIGSSSLYGHISSGIFWQFIKVKLNLPSRSWESKPRKVLFQFSSSRGQSNGLRP